MNKKDCISKCLIQSVDSALIIIDPQEHFLDKLGKQSARLLVKRIIWLIGVAKMMEIPVIVTAEDIPNLGGISMGIAKALASDTRIFNKMSFGFAAQSDILRAIRLTGRKTLALTGMETDVCIAHSALGLLGLDYQVVVIPEAVSSPDNGHKAGLERIKNAGGVIMPLKNLYYEWVRTVRKDKEVMRRMGAPPGIIL